MAQALTDTSAIYALIDRDDANHRRATAILRASVRQGVTPLIKNFIVAESHAYFYRVWAPVSREIG